MRPISTKRHSALRWLVAVASVFFGTAAFAQAPSGLSLDPNTGIISGTPTTPGTFTFTVQATNAYGNNSKSFTITIYAAPVIGSFSASSATVSPGDSVTLSWTSANAVSWSIDRGVGSVSGGTTTVTPSATTTYTLTATGAAGATTTATVTVTVVGGGPATPQSAHFPASVDTDQDLLVAADHSESTLSSGIDNATLTFPLNTASTFVPFEMAVVEGEQIELCALSGTTATPCSRGFAGTSASAHSSGVAVHGRRTGIYHNQLAQAIIAMETYASTATNHGTYPGTARTTSSWPARIATAQDLFHESDAAASTLSSSITSTATSLTLTAFSNFVGNEIVLIGNELLELGVPSGTSIPIVAHGLGGTVPAAHSQGDAVTGVISAIGYSRLDAELTAFVNDVIGAGQCTACSAALPVPTAGGAESANFHNAMRTKIKAIETYLLAHTTGGGSTGDPLTTDSFTTALSKRSATSYVDYEFGTTGNIANLTQLAAHFDPYGIAGTTVINQEWERYQTFNSSNFVFTSNTLDVTATIPSGGGLHAGGINSGQIWTQTTFAPGRKADASTPNANTMWGFEIEMKVPSGQGMWPASWFYAKYPSGSSITPNGSDGSEIDNPEFFVMNGQNTTNWTGYTHGPGLGSIIYDLRNSSGIYTNGTDFSQGYHDYQTFWTTDAVYRYIDGVLIEAVHFTYSSGSDAQFGANLAVGSSNTSGLPGLQPTSTAEFPAALSIRHIKIWSAP